MTPGRIKTQKKSVLTLFRIGVAIAVAFASIGTWSPMHRLRNLTMEELNTTIWAEGGPMYVLWALLCT